MFAIQLWLFITFALIAFVALQILIWKLAIYFWNWKPKSKKPGNKFKK